MAKLITQRTRSVEGLDISHMNEQQRANYWMIKGNTGASSQRIWAHMTGTITAGKTTDYPYDPDDLNRCLLLLEAVPEWKARIPEMKAHGAVWAALAERWDEITECFLNDVGLNWSTGEHARKTYDLMREVRESAKAEK
jgi:hypothetical protein